eukprot:TRINITY_DN69215_c0_g1_i1.p1 TRINITY_DN69215_c0_g1~~TRINITY_DN69215_c0_g1_i1.p1  ORF type:complete len:285 (-),score=56.69 TRINITY_DN69215_c0_g1_i1:513-1367(-)
MANLAPVARRGIFHVSPPRLVHAFATGWFKKNTVPWRFISSRAYQYPVKSLKLGLAIRDWASYVDKVGCRMMGHYAYLESLNRHRRVMHFREWLPQIDTDCFIAPNATVIGEVVLYKHVAIWYNAVLRGDMNGVTIGAHSQIGEKTVVRGGYRWETRIGANVNIEGGCSIVGALIADGARIGLGTVVMENALIGEHAHVGAGSVVTRDMEVGPKEYWEGTPAKFVRHLSSEEVDYNLRVTETIMDLADEHRDECNKPYEQLVTERDVKVFYRTLDAERTYQWAR